MATDFREQQSSQTVSPELPFSNSGAATGRALVKKEKSKPTQTKRKIAKTVGERAKAQSEEALAAPDPRLEPFLNRVIVGDCIEKLSTFPAESVDLIVTSPPYNLKNSSGNGMKAGTKTGKWKNNPLQNCQRLFSFQNNSA